MKSTWNFYYTTEDQPEVKIAILQKVCKRPERTKVWKTLNNEVLPQKHVHEIGYNRW
jgi:hypothetical protein